MLGTFHNTAAFLNTTIPAAGRNVGTYALPQKTLLVSAGWTIVSSGDGLALYSAVGDVLIGTGTGAGGMSNPKAWYIARRPDGGAFFCWQFIANATSQPSARVKYSLNGFTTGAPSSTVVPGPTVVGDEAVLIGGGSDAVPTGQIMYGDITAGDNPRRFFGAADSAAPYGFWFNLIAQAAANAADHGWMYDPMQPWISRPDGNDPYAHYIHIGTGQTAFENTGWASYVSAQSGPFAWINKSLATGATTGFVRHFVGPADWGVVPVTNPDTGNGNQRDVEPAFYTRQNAQAAPRGVKGAGSLAYCVMSAETVALVCYAVNGIPNAIMRLGRTGQGGVGVLWNGQSPAPSGYSAGSANLWIVTADSISAQYRMRAFDDTLGLLVRWFAPFNDSTGSLYTGPGPLSDIVADNILATES